MTVTPCEPPDRSTAVPPPASPSDDDAAAFSAFYRQFVLTLVAFLVWQGARLPDAADIAQDTMMEAYKNWSGINHPKAWARTVASRALARHIANLREDPCEHLPEHSSLLPSLTNVQAWEQRHDILRLLDPLPPRQRQVMAWTLASYAPAEIAVELRITPEAVRASLMKARRTLAELRGETEDE